MTFPKRENFQKPTNHELIVVGSKNPVKISCTQEGFMQAFDRTFSISGVQAASEVSDQPMGLEETLLGAKNRVKNAKRLFPEADFWVGVEGGVAKDSTGMYAFAWVYILAKNGKTGQAMTGTFYLPRQVMELVESGMELGHADDEIFGDKNSKQKGGSVGLLTKQKINRESYYTSAIILALIPFLNKELY
ncbi:inosine/xanthosine triphosphatase [Algoriphagus namhaensis]|uniref:Probable inosine/xanthosine triphosphatase n=1 Tax=Algoriphagus namhaensis TaxID=915353 RepID=A0ABV8APQ7_9BACT